MQCFKFGTRTRAMLLAALLAVVTPTVLSAKETEADVVQSIRQTVQSQFPELNVIDVRPAGVGGLYEVFTGKSIVYADRSGRHVFFGDIVEGATKKSVTMDRLNARNQIDFDSLPLDRAIKVVKGTGAKKIATFTDPDCPFCQKLEEELKPIDNLTVYVFLLPLPKHPNAARHSTAIWCSANRGEAWTHWMHERKEPPDVQCDGDPVKEIAALASKLNISGTPTLYFENGRRFVGSMSAAELEEAFKKNPEPRQATKNKDSAASADVIASCKAPTSDAPVDGSCTR